MGELWYSASKRPPTSYSEILQELRSMPMQKKYFKIKIKRKENKQRKEKER